MPTVAIIVVYHFGPSQLEARNRLLHGLRNLDAQIAGGDRIVLVANGVKDTDGAENPGSVIMDANLNNLAQIVPVTISHNRRGTGGLNIGVSAALRTNCEYIGPVQSSVVVGPSWLTKLRAETQIKPSAVFGRLVFEEYPERIFNDGHVQAEGRTLDHNYLLNHTDITSAVSGILRFPCLSAGLFSRGTVDAVHKLYGNFVSEELPHYGDCTDVALRCLTVGHSNFHPVPTALAYKRQPTLDGRNILASQLLNAARYYKGKSAAALTRIVKKDKPEDMRVLDDAAQAARELLARPYCITSASAPSAPKTFDAEWGT